MRMQSLYSKLMRNCKGWLLSQVNSIKLLHPFITRNNSFCMIKLAIINLLSSGMLLSKGHLHSNIITPLSTSKLSKSLLAFTITIPCLGESLITWMKILDWLSIPLQLLSSNQVIRTLNYRRKTKLSTSRIQPWEKRCSECRKSMRAWKHSITIKRAP